MQNFEKLVDMGNEAEDYPIHFAAASGQYRVSGNKLYIVL